MTQTNLAVTIIFGIMVLLGIGTGMLWDIFKVINEKWLFPKNAAFLFDAVFWIIVTIITFITLLYINDGAVRFFDVLVAVLGVILPENFFRFLLIFLQKYV